MGRGSDWLLGTHLHTERVDNIARGSRFMAPINGGRLNHKTVPGCSVLVEIILILFV
jgi:hypothetical protein